jgi:hypothetical protein
MADLAVSRGPLRKARPGKLEMASFQAPRPGRWAEGAGGGRASAPGQHWRERVGKVATI